MGRNTSTCSIEYEFVGWLASILLVQHLRILLASNAQDPAVRGARTHQWER